MGDRRATLVLLLILSVVFVSFPQIKAESKTIVVPDDYSSIQEAINNASEGDTIYVKKGVYVENPVVNKSVSLVGEDRDATVIDVTAGLKVERDNVTITGFTVYDGWAGISVLANYCKISGNKITDATIGIQIVGAENNYITGNIFQSIGLSSAIQLSYSNNNLVNENYIDSCTEGIQIREGSSNNTVTENTIVNCQDVAIRLLGSGLGRIWYGPDDNTIVRNNILNSGCGTTVYGSNGNIISNNNYVNNTVQFSANEDYYLIWGGTISVNSINENYWSDYNGTDSNGDGIGDTPYIIDENNQDNYPLMTVWIPKPSVPEFSVKLVNGTIEVKINNQSFVPYYDANTGWNISLYYNIRMKEQSEQNWTNLYLIEDVPTQSSSDYTILSYPLSDENTNSYILGDKIWSLPFGSQTDFQVQAMIGYVHRVYNPNATSQLEMYPYVFTGETSGWSDTRTITIPNQEPQQTEPIEIILAVFLIVIVIGIGLLFYFKKRHHVKIKKHSKIEQSSMRARHLFPHSFSGIGDIPLDSSWLQNRYTLG